MRNYLNQVSLLALSGLFIDVGGSAHCGWHHSLGKRLGYTMNIREEKASSDEASKDACVHSFPTFDCGCDALT